MRLQKHYRIRLSSRFGDDAKKQEKDKEMFHDDNSSPSNFLSSTNASSIAGPIVSP